MAEFHTSAVINETEENWTTHVVKYDTIIIEFVSIPLMVMVNLLIMVNVVADLTRHTTPHLLMEIVLVTADLLFSVVTASLIISRQSFPPGSPSCTAVTFFARFGLLGSFVFVMLLAVERYSKVSTPFWYNVNVTLEAVKAFILVTIVLLLIVTGLTFIHTRTLLHHDHHDHVVHFCSALMAHAEMDVIALIPAILVGSGLVTVVCNVRVLVLLHMAHSLSGSLRGGAKEPRAERMVRHLTVALSVISLCFKMPFAIVLTIQTSGPEIDRNVVRVMNVILLTGMTADPIAVVIYNHRYHRRMVTFFQNIGRLITCRRRDVDWDVSRTTTAIGTVENDPNKKEKTTKKDDTVSRDTPKTQSSMEQDANKMHEDKAEELPRRVAMDPESLTQDIRLSAASIPEKRRTTTQSSERGTVNRRSTGGTSATAKYVDPPTERISLETIPSSVEELEDSEEDSH